MYFYHNRQPCVVMSKSIKKKKILTHKASYTYCIHEQEKKKFIPKTFPYILQWYSFGQITKTPLTKILAKHTGLKLQCEQNCITHCS